MGCDIHMNVERFAAPWYKDEPRWQPVDWRVEDCWECNGTGFYGESKYGIDRNPDRIGLPCRGCNDQDTTVYDSYHFKRQAGLPPGKVREEWLDDRNYSRFAMLANVRNGSGFAGIKTGDGFEYIAEPRGLPEDVSWEVREALCGGEDNDESDGYYHSYSWCTVDELLAFLAVPRSSTYCGYVTLTEYVRWRDKGAPESWCGDISGPNIKKVTAAEMEALIRTGAVKPNDLNEPIENWIRDEYYAFVEWAVTYQDAFGKSGVDELHELKALYPDQPLRLVFGFDS